MRAKSGGSLFFLLFSLIVVLLNPTAISGLVSESNSLGPQVLEGNFFISNTSDQKTLFQLEFLGIGVTYNVTIRLHANSSSDVSFSLFPESGKRIEGLKLFSLAPNDSRTEQYVSHWDSDGIPPRYVFYQLVDSTKNASGSYYVQKVHSGYSINVGTGDIYIANITAWLETPSQTSTTTTTALPFLSLETVLIVGTISGVIFCLQKQGRSIKRK
jgi:hypothetical protein